MQNLIKFLCRIILYQTPIFLSLCKFRNILNSQQEFSKNLSMLLNDLKLTVKENIICFPENDDIIFRFLLLTIITISILSIFNIKIMQFLSGIISILFAFIYYNPFYKFNQLSDKNTFIKIINHIFVVPSANFLLLLSIGFAMISISYKNLDEIAKKEINDKKNGMVNESIYKKIVYDIESINSSFNSESKGKR